MLHSLFLFRYNLILTSLVIVFLLVLASTVRVQANDVSGSHLEKSYRVKTDQELSDLLARWGSLSPLERRLLLAETRRRLVGTRQGRKIASGEVGVQVQRRYGSSVRRSDGSTLVVNTQVTQVSKNSKNPMGKGKSSKGVSYQRIVVQPGPAGSLSGAEQSRSGAVRVTYGTGFEKRTTKEISDQKPLGVGENKASNKQRQRK